MVPPIVIVEWDPAPVTKMTKEVTDMSLAGAAVVAKPALRAAADRCLGAGTVPDASIDTSIALSSAKAKEWKDRSIDRSFADHNSWASRLARFFGF